MNCLSVFDHFVGLVLKGSREDIFYENWKTLAYDMDISDGILTFNVFSNAHISDSHENFEERRD